MNQDTTKKANDFARESSRIGLNVVAMVASRFLCLAMSLVQTGLIMRALDLEGRGQFGFALGYVSLFTVFATLSIQRLLVRDISRNPEITWTYCWTAEAVVGFLTTLVFAAIAVSVWFLRPDPQVRAAVLCAAGWGVALWALQRPFEAILVARERMVLLAVVNVAGGALRLASVFAVMRYASTSWAAHGAIAIGNLILFAVCLAAVVRVAGWSRPRIRLSLAIHQIRECLPFTCAALCSLVYFKSDISILTFLQGEAAAGVYTPAQRLTEPLMMIAGLWGTAVFPALCRLSVSSPENYKRLRVSSVRLALLVAFPMAFGIAALAGPITVILTGDPLETCAPTVHLLRMLCFVMPFFYFNGVAQESFYSAHRNWFVVGCYAVAGVVSVAANLILIPFIGVNAVALAAILANAAVTAIFLHGMRSEYGRLGLIPLIGKTLAACLVMYGVVTALAGLPIPLSIAAGAVCYAAIQLVVKALTPEEQDLVFRLLKLKR